MEERHLLQLDIVLLVLVMVLETITQAKELEMPDLIVDLVEVEEEILQLLLMVVPVVLVLSSLHILPK